MTKLYKQRRKKTFNYGANKRRLKKKEEKKSKFGVKIENRILKQNWDNRKSVKANLQSLGVASDANEVVTKAKTVKNQFIESRLGPVENTTSAPETKSSKSNKVIEQFEKEAKDSKKAPTFRFSNEQVLWITYLLDKHKQDYKAMARDPRNHYQETPAAIKQKIKRFISIPDHFVPYCRERGLLDKVQSSDT